MKNIKFKDVQEIVRKIIDDMKEKNVKCNEDSFYDYLDSLEERFNKLKNCSTTCGDEYSCCELGDIGIKYDEKITLEELYDFYLGEYEVDEYIIRTNNPILSLDYDYEKRKISVSIQLFVDYWLKNVKYENREDDYERQMCILYEESFTSYKN